MAKLVHLTIDGKEVQAPEGTLVVDAAKQVGIYIPVFCYHPKMEPVGMCRMCLVEIGRPVINRETGQPEREADGSPKVQFGPKLDTACTLPVSEGMVVRGLTEKVQAARKDVVEFLLTSHPLDCPICDKGGECPLQNLTMDFGPGKSRFLYDEKLHLAKHTPLGDLIYLDQERCIQCARCIRFQEELVDDPVIGFSQRGRALQIVTYSDPGFDSYFSGNTTDICPVGALTTTDFRFAARPWELKSAASICQQCPVGCNLTLNVRREHKSGGEIVVKRVMPRQNEWVNEIWICDKGRFAYHYADCRAEGPERLRQPLVRQDGELVPASWETALEKAAEGLRTAGAGLLTLASGRLPNEDLFNLRQFSAQLGGKTALYTHMAGGDLVAQVGVGQGTNFSDMGPETAILVVASDLQEEAPIYWMRVKQAADRGAKLIVANPRPTKLERYAKHVLRYPYGAEAALVLALLNALSAKRPELPETARSLARSQEVAAAARAFAEVENAVILFGSEGVGLEISKALAQACANLLIATDHIGKPNNGLIGIWERANNQGAWDLGFRPVDDLSAELEAADAAYIVAADPAGDDPVLAEALKSAGFLVVQELFLTDTARLADVVLPAQAFIEREGTLTNGERRVQRFYPAVPERPQALPDFTITASLGKRLGLDLEGRHPLRVMERIAAHVPDYSDVTYQQLAEVVDQLPIIGRGDLYYGGTSYENHQGLGVQLQPAVQRGGQVSLGWLQPPESKIPGDAGLLAVPVTRLYDRGLTVMLTTFLHERIPAPYVVINPTNAGALGVADGAMLRVHLSGSVYEMTARLDDNVPENVALVPRSLGAPISGPAPVRLELMEPVVA
ncbi:MAG TPA: NADH-quinone oxidoreductase subunit NuoG [Anaerolineales bacterium]|nr:NADH-quinone oxidoreductase subunit NuoG [Anaerolineales bacterium]